jgi:hypothetical protein
MPPMPLRINCGADPLVRAGRPRPALAPTESAPCKYQKADRGVGCEPGGPPHNLCRIPD